MNRKKDLITIVSLVLNLQLKFCNVEREWLTFFTVMIKKNSSLWIPNKWIGYIFIFWIGNRSLVIFLFLAIKYSCMDEVH